MSDRLQLETSLPGEPDPPDYRFDELRAEMEELREQFAAARHEVKREAVVAVLGVLTSAIREVASGTYDLDSIRGEVDGSNPRMSKVWDSWKTKLPGMPARMIEALLLHQDLSSAQLRVHMQCRLQTVYDAAFKLNKAGLINKNNGRYSLKQL